MSAELRPIREEDLGRVGEFLHENLNRRLSQADWAEFAKPPWQVEGPNHGFMLVAGGRIVGAYLAFYSERVFDGERFRFCNLAAWKVLDPFRSQGLHLLRALLGQSGYHFTDLSPSGNVVALNARLKFQELDTATALVLNLPWPVFSRRVRIVSDPAALEATLKGRDLVIYRDHRGAKAANHIAILRGEETCYVMFRRDRRKNLPLFASILYVGNQQLFREAAGNVFGHLLLHHRVPFTLAELRIVGHRTRFSKMLSSPRPKMYRSDRLSAEQIDYLYSELTCIAY